MKKIFIGTPCYGNSLTVGYLNSILATQENSIKTKEFGLMVTTVGKESLITRARNNLVASFIETDATHLFFIDADMSWSVKDFLNIINANQDVVVGACPTKTIAYENLIGKTFGTAQEIEGMVSKYAFEFNNNEDGSIPSYNGLIEMRYSGTAFMCISRRAIEKMIDAYPEGKHKNPENKDVYTLFDTMVYNEKYLSEDYAFCHKWRNIGGKVLLHPEVAIDHFGSHNFKATPIKNFFSEKL